MGIWQGFVGFLINAINYFTGIFGNTGLIILLISLVVRFALLPLSVRIAQRTKERQEMLDLLKPELEKIKMNNKSNPQVAATKTMELYKKNGIKMVDTLSITSFFIQMPLFIGMFNAISKIISPSQNFLWISNLARPDLMLTIIATVLTWLSGVLTSKNSTQGGSFMVWMPVILTLVFLLKLPAGIGLYWVASSIVSIFQAAIMLYRSNENRSVVIVT